MKTTAKLGNDTVEIMSSAKGWTTVKFKDGTTKKVRPKALTNVKQAKGRANDAKINPDLSRYHRGLGKTATKRPTLDINDPVAKKLRGLSIDEVYSVAAKELGTTAKSLRERYSHLNIGMQRMTLGNIIRHSA